MQTDISHTRSIDWQDCTQIAAGSGCNQVLGSFGGTAAHKLLLGAARTSYRVLSESAVGLSFAGLPPKAPGSWLGWARAKSQDTSGSTTRTKTWVYYLKHGQV